MTLQKCRCLLTWDADMQPQSSISDLTDYVYIAKNALTLVTFLLVWLRLHLLNNAHSLIKFILKQDEQRYTVNGYYLGNGTKTQKRSSKQKHNVRLSCSWSVMQGGSRRMADGRRKTEDDDGRKAVVGQLPLNPLATCWKMEVGWRTMIVR